MSYESICEAQKITFQRWQQAFSLWTEAQKNYFEPDAFCVNMQTCITQIRTISFILQSHKDKIDSFDQWYAPWQDKMRNDRIMTWLKDSRNKIEKQGDLEKHSNIQLKIIASYFNNGPKAIVPSRELLFAGIKSIISAIKETNIYKHFEENGILEIKRQWIANSFEDAELLSLLSYGLLFLLDMINSLNPRQQLFQVSQYRGLLLQECPSIICISLKDGKVFSKSFLPTHTKHVNVDESAVKTHYPHADDMRALPQNSLRDYVVKYMQMAKYLLQIDKSLQSLVFLSNMDTEGRECDSHVYPMVCPDRQAKYLFMRFIARQVKIHRLNTIIVVTENWFTTRKDLDPVTVLTNFPEDREGILVVACNSRGEEYSYHQEFTHKESDIVFIGEPTMETEECGAYFLEPVKEVWKNNFH